MSASKSYSVRWCFIVIRELLRGRLIVICPDSSNVSANTTYVHTLPHTHSPPFECWCEPPCISYTRSLGPYLCLCIMDVQHTTYTTRARCHVVKRCCYKILLCCTSHVQPKKQGIFIVKTLVHVRSTHNFWILVFIIAKESSLVLFIWDFYLGSKNKIFPGIGTHSLNVNQVLLAFSFLSTILTPEAIP